MPLSREEARLQIGRTGGDAFRLTQRLERDVVLRNPRPAIRRALWLNGFTDRANRGLQVEQGGTAMDEGGPGGSGG